MDLPSLAFRIVGEAPLLMHNERLASPISAESQRLKALTGKRSKTDDDYRQIARAEFDGGLYIDERGPFIPDHWITAMMRDSGKLRKQGKAVTQGVLCTDDGFPLDIRLKRASADRLWDEGFYDQRMVGNQKARVLRTRPRFDTWAVSCVVTYDASIFNERDLREILEVAGQKVGLGDYRPRFGRFRVE